jgi:Septum formation
VPAGAAPAEPAAAVTVAAEGAPAEAVAAAADGALAEAVAAEAETAVAAHAEAVPAEAVPAEAGLSGAALPGADADQDPGPEAEQENRAKEASRDVGPLAVVGVIIGVIALVGVAAGVLAMVTHGFKPKTVVSYRPAAVFGLRPGQCINSGSSSLSYTVVSCTSPHDAEVFARFSLPAAAWPGSSAVRQQAGDACASKLGGYLNPQLATIGLTQEYVYPNRDAWDADQRTVVCEVSSGNGKLTGSVRAKG